MFLNIQKVMVDLYLLSIVVFIAGLALLVYRDRKKIEIKNFLIMRRTKRFADLIDRVAKFSPTVWKVLSTISIIVAFYYMVVGIFLIIDVANQVFSGAINQPALQFIFPVPTTQVVSTPGFIGIPFWFWIVTIAAILVPHEAMHGIISRVEKIKLKSVGVFLLAFLPGAFVEPNETQLKKAKLISRLRVFSVGSFINIVIAFNIIIFGQYFLWAGCVAPGIMVLDVNQTSPAYAAGLEPGMVIESIGDYKMETNFLSYSYSTLSVKNSLSAEAPKYFSGALLYSGLKHYEPNDTVTVYTDSGDFDVVLGESKVIEDFAYLGIEGSLNTEKPEYFASIFPLLGIISVLSMAVAIVNILPIYPLDGGLMIEALVGEIANKKNTKTVVMAITWFVLLIILYSFFGPMF